MKKFYERFKDCDEKLRHAVAVLPWWNTLKLMSKLGDNDEAILYYAQETVRKGWNRDLLLNALKMKMHENQPAPIDNNFERTLPATQAAYANEVFSSKYMQHKTC
jgi:predicted nuclease of restriction endonuclease-like (RecB) superfamily